MWSQLVDPAELAKSNLRDTLRLSGAGAGSPGPPPLSRFLLRALATSVLTAAFFAAAFPSSSSSGSVRGACLLVGFGSLEWCVGFGRAKKYEWLRACRKNMSEKWKDEVYG